jgi:hypothetical protein
MKQILLALALLLTPAAGYADDLRATFSSSDVALPLSGSTPVACNAAAASRTFVLKSSPKGQPNAQAFQSAVLFIRYVYNAGTAVAMVCQGSDDSGSTLFDDQWCDTTSGVCTSHDASWSRAISAANKKFTWKVGLKAPYTSCVISCTGGGANDTLYVTRMYSTLP